VSYPLLLAVLLLVVIAWRLLARQVERCPDCGSAREHDHPICDCGYVFEYPETDEPMEYGDPDEEV
jgi:hypothetical protein